MGTTFCHRKIRFQRRHLYRGDIHTRRLVTGEQWGVTIENDSAGPVSWQPSGARLGNFRVDGAFFKVDIESDDGGGFTGDEDFNDLLLTAAKPLATGERIVYGNVNTSEPVPPGTMIVPVDAWNKMLNQLGNGDRCLFNPCFEFPWIVIDTPYQLERLLRHDSIRTILERGYGADVATRVNRGNFQPMMLSRGASTGSGYKDRGTTDFKMSKKGKAKTASLETISAASVLAADRFDYRPNLTIPEATIIDNLIPLRRCSTDPLAVTIMQFVEYDRTAAEQKSPLGNACHSSRRPDHHHSRRRRPRRYFNQ